MFEILAEDDDSIEFMTGRMDFADNHGRVIVQKDFRVNGEVWRVHKYDADPYPSNPHAHCVDGRPAFKGGKMHLGTGEVYKNGAATGQLYKTKDFLALCEKLSKKFPDIKLPLPVG